MNTKSLRAKKREAYNNYRNEVRKITIQHLNENKMKEPKFFTLSQLLNIKPGAIFMAGITTNDDHGINLLDTRPGARFKWYAIKSETDLSWTIRIHLESISLYSLVSNGRQITDLAHVQKLIPCTEKCLLLYRK